VNFFIKIRKQININKNPLWIKLCKFHCCNTAMRIKKKQTYGYTFQNVYQVILLLRIHIVDMFMYVKGPKSKVTEFNLSGIRHPVYTDFTHRVLNDRSV